MHFNDWKLNHHWCCQLILKVIKVTSESCHLLLLQLLEHIETEKKKQRTLLGNFTRQVWTIGYSPSTLKAAYMAVFQGSYSVVFWQGCKGWATIRLPDKKLETNTLTQQHLSHPKPWPWQSVNLAEFVQDNTYHSLSAFITQKLHF